MEDGEYRAELSTGLPDFIAIVVAKRTVILFDHIARMCTDLDPCSD
jgi:hypothetical protein